MWPFRMKDAAALEQAWKERDEAVALANKQAADFVRRERQIGAALNEALKDRDALQARLDALTPARGERGRFVGKAVSNG